MLSVRILRRRLGIPQNLIDAIQRSRPHGRSWLRRPIVALSRDHHRENRDYCPHMTLPRRSTTTWTTPTTTTSLYREGPPNFGKCNANCRQCKRAGGHRAWPSYDNWNVTDGPPLGAHPTTARYGHHPPVCVGGLGVCVCRSRRIVLNGRAPQSSPYGRCVIVGVVAIWVLCFLWNGFCSCLLWCFWNIYGFLGLFVCNIDGVKK